MRVKRPGNRGIGIAFVESEQLEIEVHRIGKLMVMQGGFGSSEIGMVPSRRSLLRTVVSLLGVMLSLSKHEALGNERPREMVILRLRSETEPGVQKSGTKEPRYCGAFC